MKVIIPYDTIMSGMHHLKLSESVHDLNNLLNKDNLVSL